MGSLLFDAQALARAAAAPDDPSVYLVLADVLEDAGDPRGKWVSLLHEAERGSGDDFARLTALERRYFAKHRKALVGLPAHVLRAIEVEWRWGFMHRALVGSSKLDPAAMAAAVEALLAAPAAQFLRSLSIGQLDGHDARPAVDAVVAQAPRLLGALVVGDDAPAQSLRKLESGDLGALRSLPLLESLTVRGARFSFSLELPRLRHLALGLVNEPVLSAVAAVQWPEVESLELRLDWPAPGVSQPQLLKRFLEAAWLPKLQSLTVTCCTASDQVARVLAKGRWAGVLTGLDLSCGTLTRAGLQTLVSSLPALTSLVVDQNHVDEEEVSRPSLSIEWGTRRGQGRPAPQRPQEVLARARSAAPTAFLASRLEQAAGIAHRRGEVSSEAQLLHQLGVNLHARGELAAARGVLTRALALDASADSQLLLAKVSLALGAPREGRRLALLALERFEPSSSRARRIDALETLAQCASNAGQFKVAKRRYSEAEGLASGRFVGSAELGTHFTGMQGVAAQRGGDFALAKKLHAKAIKGASTKRELAKRVYNAATNDWQMHRFEAAETGYLKALQLSRESGYEANEGYSLVGLAHLATWRTRPQEAIGHLNAARVIFRKINASTELANALSILADAHLMENDTDLAEATAKEALLLQRRLNDLPHASTSLKILADVALNRSETARAEAFAKEALEIDRSLGPGFRLGQAGVFLKLSYCQAQSGELEKAHELASQAGELYASMGFDHGWAEAARAAFALCGDALSSALKLIEQALSKSSAARDVSNLRRYSAFKAVLEARRQRPEAARVALSASAAVEPATAWDAQSAEYLALARSFVEGGAEALHAAPIAYEARLVFEFLKRSADSK